MHNDTNYKRCLPPRALRQGFATARLAELGFGMHVNPQKKPELVCCLRSPYSPLIGNFRQILPEGSILKLVCRGKLAWTRFRSLAAPQ